jgi:hypothetical protein
MLLAAFAITAMTACVNDDPTVARPSPGAPMLPSGSTSGEGAVPTGSTSDRTGSLTSGHLTLQLSGDVEVEKTLDNLVSTFYAPPPGGLTIVWTGGDDDATTVGVGGSTFTGTRPSSPELSVSVVAQTPGSFVRFVSTAGECSVTLDVANADRISGSFDCDELVATSGEVVEASASFVATG